MNYPSQKHISDEPYSNITETLLFSLLMSSMTCVAASGHLGLNSSNLKRVFIMFNVIDSNERWILANTIGAILGAWFGVWPVPLDWERWWQAWPIPCLVGSLLGYSLSIILMALGSLLQKQDLDKHRKD